MGKRSEFERVGKDYYRTIDDRAVTPLLPHLKYGTKFAEVCAGDGTLTDKLVNTGFLRCVAEYDIEPQHDRIKVASDALNLSVYDLNHADIIITNPPWTRSILHPLIIHLKNLAPTYLLFDADWMHTKQAIPYLDYCTDIISVGRLIWIEGTTMTGKDNVCWYRFDKEPSKTITFHPKFIL